MYIFRKLCKRSGDVLKKNMKASSNKDFRQNLKQNRRFDVYILRKI